MGDDDTMSRRRFVSAAGLAGASLAFGPAASAAAARAKAVQSRTRLGGTGTAILLSGSEPEQWDPGTASLALASTIDLACYDGLFIFDGWKRKNHLCQSFSVSKDGTVLTLHLRPGVKFHDGTTMTSADAVFSLQRMLQLQGPITIFWNGLVDSTGVTAVDNQTMRIELNRPSADFVNSLAWMFVVNKAQVLAHEKSGDLGQAYLLSGADAGTGPFTITNYQPGNQMTLTRFPRYWKGWGPRYLDGVVIQVVREPATIQLQMSQGQGDIVDLWSLPVDNQLALAQSGATTLKEYAIPSVVAFMMNNQKYPTSNRDFRKACAYAFDYQAIWKGINHRHDAPVSGAYPPQLEYYKSFAKNSMLYRRDLKKAREYLKKSGFNPHKSNVRLSVDYRSFDPTQRDYSLVLQSSLKDIGLTIHPEALTGPVFHERQKLPTTAAHFNRISGESLSPAPDLYCTQFYDSHSWEGGKGYWATMAFFKNNAVDKLLAEARVARSGVARKRLFARVQEIVYSEVPHIWVDQQHWLTSVSSRLGGFTPFPLGAQPTYLYPLYRKA